MTTTRQGSGNNVRKDFKELRVKEAQERQVAWTALGPAGQLKALDERPGNSLKQRTRLEAQLRNKTKKVVAAPEKALEVAKEVASNKPKAKDRRAAEQLRTASSK